MVRQIPRIKKYYGKNNIKIELIVNENTFSTITIFKTSNGVEEEVKTDRIFNACPDICGKFQFKIYDD